MFFNYQMFLNSKRMVLRNEGMQTCCEYLKLLIIPVRQQPLNMHNEYI